MTETEFITLHQTGVINYSGRINVNILDNGDNTGTITGITVSVDALSVNGVETSPDVNIDNVLNQVETIRFTYNDVFYELEVLEKTKYTGTGIDYYYYKVQSNIQVDIPSSGVFTGGTYDTNYIQENTTISFTPFINDLIFAVSNYNATFNNAIDNRQSSIRVQADRSNDYARPSNFDAIASGSATYAFIQDSLYSDTGNVNSRYNGSKSTPGNYGGVSPSLAVRAFRGEVYTDDANIDLVCGTLESDRILVELAHTGPEKLPTFSSSSLGINTANNINSVEQNIIVYSGNPSQSLDEGDILQIENTSMEKLRIQQYNAFTKTIIVQRGYLGSTPNSSISTGTPIFKLDRNDILQFGDNNSKVTAVNNAIVYVKDDNRLVYTDDFGSVFSSSVCPPPTFLYLGSEDVQ